MPHPRDTLTPVQRFAAANAAQSSTSAAAPAPDRLPCVPIVGNTAARVIGCKVSDFRGNGRLIADAQVAAYRRFGYDVIRIFTDLYTQAEAMGARVHYPDDETAYLAAPAIASPSEIDRLRPADPHKDGNLPAFLEAMDRAQQAVGAEVPVNGALTGPFTVASFLIGAETLNRLLLKGPPLVHRLCEIATEAALAYADAILDTGCTPSLTDAMCSSTVISPRQFREFGAPYLKRLIDHIHARGKAVTLHICGKTAPIWNDMADTGADCLSIDNAASLAEAKTAVGARVRLMGNVPPSEVMLLGTPAQVREAVRERVRQAHDSPKGLIVASGCSLPVETPFANIDAMLDAVREIGWPGPPSLQPQPAGPPNAY
ncbi:MAG: uroporphyrinogen decarboxylase family protein, partial [Verrucomicrobiota bacterium]|nr:uroporphyrinogen decarboxylase family protein [Verrucomicrobiota bacterium]